MFIDLSVFPNLRELHVVNIFSIEETPKSVWVITIKFSYRYCSPVVSEMIKNIRHFKKLTIQEIGNNSLTELESDIFFDIDDKALLDTTSDLCKIHVSPINLLKNRVTLTDINIIR